MKTSELKKLLKTATMKAYVDSPRNGIACGWLTLNYGQNNWNYVRMDCQANTIENIEKEKYEWGRLKGDRFRSLPHLGNFYALHADVRPKMLTTYNDTNGDMVEALRKLFTKEIQDKNLNYVTNCELTQAVTVLESLGVILTDVTVEGKPSYDWYRAWREKESEKEWDIAVNSPVLGGESNAF